MPPDPIQWPAPHALPAGPLVNYGYEGEVLLLTDIKVAPDARPGDTLTLGAKAEWLVCKETCIPEEAQLDLALPVAERSDPYPQWGKAIAATRDALPARRAWLAVRRARRRTEGGGDADRARPARPRRPASISSRSRKVRSRLPASRSFVRDANGTFVLTLPVANQLAPGFTRVAGVITADQRLRERRQRPSRR